MTVRIKRKDEEMVKALFQQCEGEMLSTQRKKNKSRATAAGKVLERASEPPPSTDSLQHVQASMSPNDHLYGLPPQLVRFLFLSFLI